MIYSRPGRLGRDVSRIGLGGHEFLPDGRSRGFNEDYARATTPGVIFPGFGGDKRKAVLRAACQAGINFFDATIDSEKDALARNLREFPPPGPVHIQTRPEGMCWTNNPADPDNQLMADLALLREEVKRILALTGWPRIDFLNFGFMGSALQADPGYLSKLSGNITALREEGLIRFATADTFSGEEVYLRAIATGAFDAIFITLGFANDGGLRRVLPEAVARGMAVFTREVFAKGALFAWGMEAGIPDRDLLARAALKWLLAVREVTTVVVGAGTPHEIIESARVLDDAAFTPDEEGALAKVMAAPACREYRSARLAEFQGK